MFKLKRKPRGKSFAKGNKFGNRFPPGVSGCPGGRAKYKLLSEAYKATLELDEDQKFVGTRSNAEAIAQKIIDEAKKGKVNAASELADRLEGKPRQAYEVKMSILDELSERMEKARKRAMKK